MEKQNGLAVASFVRGFAIAGLITGLVGIALYVVVILFIGVSFMAL